MTFRGGTFTGSIAIALAWAFIWALPGGFIELVDNIAPSAHGFTRQVDMWMQTLGLPGLIAGVVFSLLLLTMDRRVRLDELGAPRSGGWGAVAGLLTGALVAWGLDSGLSDPAALAAGALAYATLMGAVRRRDAARLPPCCSSACCEHGADIMTQLVEFLYPAPAR